MRSYGVALICLALASAALSAQAPQTTPRQNPPVVGTARIRGQVLSADTGDPVRGARVDLTVPGTGGWTATTDRDGRFEIARISAGRFVLSVTKAGFVTTSFRQPQPQASGGGTNIDLTDGQLFDHADVRLSRGAVIIGRVIDDNGEPVVDAYVTALKLEYSNGARRLRSQRQEQTNDLGEFRLYGLPAGNYYVSAGMRSAQVSAVDTGTADSPRQFVAGGEGMAPTFFPGTVRTSDAQPIVVEAGGTAPPIAISQQSVRLSRISGTIVKSSGGPPTGMLAILNPVTTDGVPMAFNLAEADADGHFTLPNIVPGIYHVDVLSKSILENVAKTGSSSSLGRPQDASGDEFASVTVSVNGDDIDGLVVTMSSGFQLAGRIVVEGGPAGVDALANVLVAVKPVIPSMSEMFLRAWGAVAADATFVVRGSIGTRMVRMEGLPEGWALKSVRVAGVDVTDAGLEFNRDFVEVEIVVTAKPAQVSGVVADDHGAPLRDCAVAIFSEDRRLWTLPATRYIASARTDASGQFTVAAMPPGAYFAIAADVLPAGEWAEPENLEKLRAKATAFSLGDGELKTISLVFPPR